VTGSGRGNSPQPQRRISTHYRPSRRNTTAFKPWIRAVNLGENPRSTPLLSFRIPAFKRQACILVDRNRSERSGFRTVLRRRPVRPRNEAMSERTVGERHIFEGCANVPTAQSEHHDTPESADACWRPRGQNNTGTPYTVEDRGNGHSAWPAVHQPDAVGLPAPERSGSPMIGLRT
jgi:hypothetical protein